MFAVDPIGPSVKFLEIRVTDTYGSSKTYLNQVFLIERNPKFRVSRPPPTVRCDVQHASTGSSIRDHIRNFVSEEGLD